MATTLVPPTTAPKPASGEVRFVSVRAHLVPDEVIIARQALVVRKQVVIGLVAFVVLLIGWFALSWWQTKSANGDLDAAQRQATSLQTQQNQFAPLVQAQSEISTLQTQLHQAMAKDLSWKDLLTTLRTKAPAGVTVSGVSGDVAAAAPVVATVGTPAVPATATTTVGSLTITGTAPDKKAVAAYADQLAKVPSLSAPLVSSVQGADHNVAFTVTAQITSVALGGRYALPVTTATPLTGGH